jgi:3-oxoacyl-[acyl-carrier-protein] synthase-3
VTSVGIVGTRAWLPEGWMPAAAIAEASGIPEQVVVEKFGLRGKHVAGPDEHVSTMATTVGRQLLDEQQVDPASVDAVVYFGSTWKDHPVWQAAPAIAHALGCDEAFALELDYVSCGSPVALRVCRDLLLAEDDVRTVLAVAACRESHLVDYANPRARFTYNFADGATAALLRRDHPANRLLGAHMVTDGSFAHHVRVPAGGSVEPASAASVAAGHHLLDVADPVGMKERLDPVTLPNFVRAAEEACKKSGATLDDVAWVCGIHMKRSIHEALLDALGIDHDRATYLDDTGHMSGVDPLLALDRETRAGTIRDGDLVLLLAAGTGYTWAAQVVRWGPA